MKRLLHIPKRPPPAKTINGWRGRWDWEVFSNRDVLRYLDTGEGRLACVICAEMAVFRFTAWRGDRRMRIGCCEQHVDRVQAHALDEMQYADPLTRDSPQV